MRSRWGKKAISYLLALVMVLGLLPMSALAATENEIKLYIGESAEITIDGVDLSGNTYTPADKTIASVMVSATQFSTEISETKTTSLPTTVGWSGQFAIQSNRGSTYLKNTNDNSNSQLDLVSKNEATIWIITRTTEGYTVQDGEGKYLAFGYSNRTGTATLQNGANELALSYLYYEDEGWFGNVTTGYAWQIQGEGDVYLNQYGGAWSSSAAGYNAGITDSGSRWNLYAVTETLVGTKVTFTGLKPGTTTVDVNGTEYTVTVEPRVENVKVYEGGSKEFSVADTSLYSERSEEIGWVEGVADVTLRSGNELVIKGLNEGTTSLIAYGTQYNIEVVPPTYAVEVAHVVNGTETPVTGTIAIKNVTASTTYDLNATVTMSYEGESPTTVDGAVVSWAITHDPNRAAASVDQNGLVTFSGVSGTVQVTALYKLDDDSQVTRTVIFSVSTESYILPEDGTDDFPEYPNEGAVRLGKTATAVGNFSETGLAMIELAMTGVPYTKGSEIDVVIMVDMSNGMGTNNRVTPAKNAVISALNALVKNEDGTYNNNRVAIYTFSGYNSNTDYTGTNSGLNPGGNGSCDLQSFDADSLASMETTINGWSADGGTNYSIALRKCHDELETARTDGIGNNRKQFVIFVTDGAPTYSFSYVDGSTANDPGVMSGEGYANDINLSTAAGRTEYYSQKMKESGVTVYSIGIQMTESSNEGTILKKIAGWKMEDGTVVDATNADHSKYAQFIEDDVSELTTVFGSIVSEIKQAATNVKVYDQISPDYSIAFAPPNTAASTALGNQAMYIQIVEYQLDANKERTGEPSVLEKFWYDKQWQHTVGGVDCREIEDEGADGICDHVEVNESGQLKKIGGIYFATTFNYEEDEQTLTWSAKELSNTELAMQYFVHLNGAGAGAASGTYSTNTYAYATYTNYQENECRNDFPSPQLTYNGAQVSYVFYLVNEDGEPVNRAGRVVPFAEAVYVTDVYTYAKTWIEGADSGFLEAEYLAHDKVPTAFELYDKEAYYEIRVYEKQSGTNQNHFIIEGGNVAKKDTTKVFNTKAGTRYDTYGAYSATAGSYTSKRSGTVYTVDEKDTLEGFDYANTTVAFAVVWTLALAEDETVVDFGLPVIIDTAANDALAGHVVGVRKDAPADVDINSGQFMAKKDATATLVDENNEEIAKVAIESGTSIRFTPSKVLNKPVTFYYEYEAQYYDTNGALVTTEMYSSVTVIPASNVLYEESFILKGGSWTSSGTAALWFQSPANEAPYGYDVVYSTSTGPANGAYYVTTVSKGAPSDQLVFSFIGTGFDVIGSCGPETGTMVVTVAKTPLDADGTPAGESAFYKRYIADTEYTAETYGTIEQVPILHAELGENALYTVTISGAYVDYNEDGSPASMTLTVDGFRVYRNTDAAAYEKAEQEYGATYVNVLDAVNGGTLSKVYIEDTVKETIAVTEYEAAGGPQFEIYLPKGSSVAFKVNGKTPVQISARNVSPVANAALNGTELSHATELYYEVEAVNGVVTITNNGAAGSLLALCNLKLQADAKITALEMDDYPVVYAMLRSNGASVIDAPAAETPFHDVSGHWAKSYITDAYQAGLINGTGANTFEPESALTRSMFITLLYRLAGSPAVDGVTPFADVPGNTWYTNAVAWGYSNGIVNGKSATNFDPNGNITRQELAVMLMRYAKHTGAAVDTAADLSGFADSAEAAGWAVDAMEWAVGEGIISGRSGNALAPTGVCNRAEAATILVRYAGL